MPSACSVGLMTLRAIVLDRDRTSEHRLEQERFRAKLQEVLLNHLRKGDNHWNRSGPVLSLRRSDVFSPDATSHYQYLTVVIFQFDTTQLAAPKPGETGNRHDGSRRFRQYCQHP